MLVGQALLAYLLSYQLATCNSLDECVQTSHKNDKPKQAYHASCPQKGQTPQVQGLDGETSMGLTTLLTRGLTVSLTTSLTEGSEEDEGTKCVEIGRAHV